jgi:hypothetical protein
LNDRIEGCGILHLDRCSGRGQRGVAMPAPDGAIEVLVSMAIRLAAVRALQAHPLQISDERHPA